jgi:hypothetical protein
MPIAIGIIVIGLGVVLVAALIDKTTGTASAAAPSATPTVPGGGMLPKSAASKLNPSQQKFASELAAKTGLNPTVIAAWVLSEEPASASQAPNGAHNWLNIGSTDAGFYGADNPAWRDPVSAADFTARWLSGATATGFGRASSGIRAILQTADKSVAEQVAAIQHSGWASSGYPGLAGVVASLAGG